MLALIANTRGQWACDLPQGVSHFCSLNRLVDYEPLRTDSRSLLHYETSRRQRVSDDVIEPWIVSCRVCGYVDERNLDEDDDVQIDDNVHNSQSSTSINSQDRLQNVIIFLFSF